MRMTQKRRQTLKRPRAVSSLPQIANLVHANPYASNRLREKTKYPKKQTFVALLVAKTLKVVRKIIVVQIKKLRVRN